MNLIYSLHNVDVPAARYSGGDVFCTIAVGEFTDVSYIKQFSSGVDVRKSLYGMVVMNSNLFQKLWTTPKTLIPEEACARESIAVVAGEQLSAAVRKLFRGSLAIRVVTAGSTNACEQELVALGNSYYDVERFGVHFVASPRHADMLMVTGPVSRNMRQALIDTYEAMSGPRIVVAVGDDAIHGGVFRGSYAVLDGVKSVIPVHYEIPGDPPSPLQILSALYRILNDLESDTSQRDTSEHDR